MRRWLGRACRWLAGRLLGWAEWLDPTPVTLVTLDTPRPKAPVPGDRKRMLRAEAERRRQLLERRGLAGEE